MYILNYGVNYSHRSHNNKTFERYKDAQKEFQKLDRETWGCGEILKVVSQGVFKPIKLIEKDFYDSRNNMYRKGGKRLQIQNKK
jgi:hypothetical protein